MKKFFSLNTLNAWPAIPIGIAHRSKILTIKPGKFNYRSAA